MWSGILCNARIPLLSSSVETYQVEEGRACTNLNVLALPVPERWVALRTFPQGYSTTVNNKYVGTVN